MKEPDALHHTMKMIKTRQVRTPPRSLFQELTTNNDNNVTASTVQPTLSNNNKDSGRQSLFSEFNSEKL